MGWNEAPVLFLGEPDDLLAVDERGSGVVTLSFSMFQRQWDAFGEQLFQAGLVAAAVFADVPVRS